jgi:hypothetical protein
MSVTQLLSNNILQSKALVGMHLDDFSDADMMARPVKSANHAIWQIGHLANSTRNMVSACDASVKFPFEDDARFGKSKASFDDASQFPNKAELLARFNGAMDVAAAWVASLSDADLAKPTPEFLQRFAPTFGNIVFMLAAHPLMHLGQFQVARRALGKPNLM